MLLSKKMSEALNSLKDNKRIKKNEEFALATGMSWDRLKNILSGRVKKLAPQESLAAQYAYGIRAAWWHEEGDAMWLAEHELESAPDPHALRMVTTEVTQLGLPEHEALTLRGILFSMRTKNSEALSRQLRRMGGTDASDFVFMQKSNPQALTNDNAILHTEVIVDHLAFSREWLQKSLGINPAYMVLIDVRGDSMSPTINVGDLLLLNTCPEPVRSEGIYALNLNGALLLKRLHISVSGTIEILSDNTRYSPETISAEELKRLPIIGKAVWHGRRT